MKSIMEEASSIMKAIEKCWNRADKPQEFSIKILEKPEKNFFGFTTKPAKVVLFYNTYTSHHQKSYDQKDSRHDSRPRHRKPYRKYYNNNQNRYRDPQYKDQNPQQAQSYRRNNASDYEQGQKTDHNGNKNQSSSS